jgi:cellulose synthase/poly-beta-1,6-N-acetylglucosamine synthase-like glycosyltransferase
MIYFFLFFLSAWVIFLVAAYRAQLNLISLDEFAPQEVNFLAPTISIITPVRNAEKDIEVTLTKLLTANPVNCEIIAVNDRSTDKTEEILLRMAKDFPALKVVQIRELPDGWLGKVHALHQGSKYATGDYMLFMDVDVEVNQDVLKSAVKACDVYKLDHLGVLPNFFQGEYLLNVMTATTILLFTLSARTWNDIAKRPLGSTKGVGAFNLVKKSKFDQTEGFEWLKMDVADDVALAQLIAKNGGRSLLMKAGKHGPSLHWYESFKDLINGLEKNIVGGFTNYKLSLVLIMSIFSVSTLVVPMIAISFYNYQSIFSVGIEFLIFTLVFALMIKKFMKHSFLTIASLPLGIFLMGIILLRSSYICFKNGGISWSGTFYTLKELKAGTRVKLGL